MTTKTRTAWSDVHREAARAFLSRVMPQNPSILVENLEDIMPVTWRSAFEELFDRVESLRALASRRKR
jgi:hypothetical protein